MANTTDGKWITVNGAHIFIKNGQSVGDAFKEKQTKSSKISEGMNYAINNTLKAYKKGAISEEQFKQQTKAIMSATRKIQENEKIIKPETAKGSTSTKGESKEKFYKDKATGGLVYSHEAIFSNGDGTWRYRGKYYGDKYEIKDIIDKKNGYSVKLRKYKSLKEARELFEKKRKKEKEKEKKEWDRLYNTKNKPHGYGDHGIGGVF